MLFGIPKILLGMNILIPAKLLNAVNILLKVLERISPLSLPHAPHYFKSDSPHKLLDVLLGGECVLTSPVLKNPTVLFEPDNDAHWQAPSRRWPLDASRDDTPGMPMRQEGFQREYALPHRELAAADTNRSHALIRLRRDEPDRIDLFLSAL